VAHLKRLALLELIQILATFWIAIGAYRFLSGREEAVAARTKASHYAAWQLVNSAQGKGGSGGRIDALQDLVRDRVSLEQVNLETAWLDSVNLPHANLRFANLKGAQLSNANLEGANLAYAELRGAIVMFTNLRNSDLQFGNFAGGYLKYSKLHNAILIGANLENANLRGADMSGSNLAGANVRGVDLSYANLRDAHLFQDELWGGAKNEIQNWREIRSLEKAVITGVRDAPPGFRRWAVESMGAIDSTSGAIDSTSTSAE
jgi:hypothetical protein